MRKKKSSLSLEQFRPRFLRLLQSCYLAKPVIARIVKDKALREECATLLWLTENDARDRIARQTTQQRNALIKVLDDAILGAEAFQFIYTKLDNKPHLAEYMNTLRSDALLKRQVVDAAFAPPKAYGRDRDWSIVRYAKEILEQRLQTSIPNQVLTELLNAADQVVGRKFARGKTQVDEADVDAGLRRLRQRTFERVLPYYRQMLSEHYPRASDLPKSA